MRRLDHRFLNGRLAGVCPARSNQARQPFDRGLAPAAGKSRGRTGPTADAKARRSDGPQGPEDFDDARIQALVATGQESIDWARKVTLEFKSFFESILVLS